MLPFLFYCFLESRSEQEVALSAAAISALTFFSILAALTCFLFSLVSSCHANTTNRFHIKFFPHCIPPRLVSSVVSSRSSFRCKAYWENAASCLVFHGTCGAFLFLLFCPVFSAVILFHFPFHCCQNAVFVITFFLFICRPSNSSTFRLHTLSYFLRGRFFSFSNVSCDVLSLCILF